MEDDAWAQCAIAVKKGRLGLRTANQVSAAAFIASRITSRPHVREMAQHLEQAGLGRAEIVMAAYDQRTEILTLYVSLFSAPKSKLALNVFQNRHFWDTWNMSERQKCFFLK